MHSPSRRPANIWILITILCGLSVDGRAQTTKAAQDPSDTLSEHQAFGLCLILSQDHKEDAKKHFLALKSELLQKTGTPTGPYDRQLVWNALNNDVYPHPSLGAPTPEPSASTATIKVI